jgi:osmoprotectant transport system permease protein
MVQRVFESEYGLIWLRPFGFNNTYALITRREYAEELDIVTISDLVRYIKRRRGAISPLAGQF